MPALWACSQDREGNQMNEPESPATYRVESASDDFKFHYEWALQVRRQNMDFTNEVLRRLVTLAASLLGGSVVLVNSQMMPTPFQALTIAAFFCALVTAFIGMLPKD